MQTMQRHENQQKISIEDGGEEEATMSRDFVICFDAAENAAVHAAAAFFLVAEAFFHILKSSSCVSHFYHLKMEEERHWRGMGSHFDFGANLHIEMWESIIIYAQNVVNFIFNKVLVLHFSFSVMIVLVSLISTIQKWRRNDIDGVGAAISISGRIYL